MKKTTREEANFTVHISKKRGEAASLKTHPEMNDSAGKRRKR